MHHVQTKGHLQRLHAQMMQCAHPRRAIRQLTRFGLGQRDQFTQRAGLDLAVGGQKQRRARHDGHGLEVLGAIGHLGIDVGIDRDHRAVRDMQGVAIGWRLGGELGRRNATGTGTVLHHHRLPPFIGQLLLHQPSHRVGQTAGGKADVHLHRTLGVAARRLRRSQRRQQQRTQQRTQQRRHQGCRRPGTNPGRLTKKPFKTITYDNFHSPSWSTLKA